MPCTARKAVLLACLACGPGAGAAQESAVDETAASDVQTSDETVARTCFNITRALDISVLSDQHVYVKTVGGNQYLLTMGMVCQNLKRAYLSGSLQFPSIGGRPASGRRDGVRIQPYGNTVCPNDGSHLIYTWFDRDTVCPILTIEPIESRTEARRIAEQGRIPVDMKEVDPSD